MRTASWTSGLASLLIAMGCHAPEEAAIPLRATATRSVLYRGIFSPVGINVFDGVCDSLILRTEDAEVLDHGGWIVIHPTWKTPDTLLVGLVCREGQSNGTLKFLVATIPDPTLCFAGSCSDEGQVSKLDIERADALIAPVLDFEYDIRFAITRFTMVIEREGQEIFRESADSEKLNISMADALHLAVEGDLIRFTEAAAKGPDGTLRKLQPLQLKLM